MFTRAVFIASSLILAAGSTSAHAADIYAPSAGGYKDPVIQEQIALPEAEVFQEYAEWYIRGDVGVGMFGDLDGTGNTQGPGFAVTSLDFDNYFNGGVGFGRYVTPNVRLGLDLDYRHRTASNFYTGDPSSVPELTNLGSLPLELTTTALMFNAVYDFTPQRRFSPYIGGGIGWAFHNLDMKGVNFTNNLDGGALETATVSGASNSSSAFAANVMAGVSVNIRRGLFLDVGYKFSYLGDADVDFDYTHPGPAADFDPTIELNDIMVHEFKVGLRYDLY